MEETEFLDLLRFHLERTAVFKKRDFVFEKMLVKKASRVLEGGWQMLFDAEAFRRIEFTVIPQGSNDALTGVEIRNMHTNESFTLDDWCAFRNNQRAQSLFRLQNQPGDSLDQRLINYFQFIDDLLSDQELNEILCGRLWIDVPFDCEWFK